VELRDPEQRAALPGSRGASGDDALELQTQIARTYGMRRRFEAARQILAGIEAAIPRGGAAAGSLLPRAGPHLCVARARAAEITPEAREKARSAYTQAFEKAKAARLDYLAVDALHMMNAVDAEPADQLAWDRRRSPHEASTQEGRRSGKIANNPGYAYHLAGRYDEALAQFRSLAAYERAGRAANVRIAHWMIARRCACSGQGAGSNRHPAPGAGMERGRRPGPLCLRGAGKAFQAGNAALAEAYAAKLLCPGRRDDGLVLATLMPGRAVATVDNAPRHHPWQSRLPSSPWPRPRSSPTG
jgi:tetratricopeptide (TPR) repeat protein